MTKDKAKKWSGVWVATVTPFRRGQLDLEGMQAHVRRLLEAGVNGLCPCGTTGEGSSLTEDEFKKVVQLVLKEADGKIPVVAGTGTNNTEKTIERTKLAQKMGADGALVVTPYYLKPTQEGLYRHFTKVSAAVEIPLILYNIAGRAAVNMLPETVERIVAEANIGAIKECGDLSQVMELIDRVGDRIAILSGEDGGFLPFLSVGGDGLVSVTGNVLPKTMLEILNLHRDGRVEEAAELFRSYQPIFKGLFMESNPIPVKACLNILGRLESELRLPMVEMSLDHRRILERTMRQVDFSRG